MEKTQVGDTLLIRKGNLALLLLSTLLGLLLVLRLGQVPPLWYDEGWVLSLAKNWVERGHYGHLRLGDPVPAGIPFTGMPAVAPVALSFRLFGIGPWQARLPGILTTVGALGLLYYVARRLYDRSVAQLTLLSVLLLSAHADLHPVVIGRQALGEMPAMFLLLAGFAAFTWAWRRPLWSMPFAILLWALAVRTKPQMLPFLFAGLALPLAIALWQHRWQTTRILVFGLIGALFTSAMLARGQELLLRSSFFAPSSGHDLYSWLDDASNYLFTYVIVPDLPARFAATLSVFFGMPTLLALWYAARKAVKIRHHADLENEQGVCRLVLWAMAASWLGWFLLCSPGYPRYLFPAVFLGSVFVAVLLQDAAGGLNLPRLLGRGKEVLKQRPASVSGLGLLLTAIAIPAALVVTAGMLFRSYTVESDDSLLRTVHFLNTQTSPESLIETYETELFFLLERSFHYPPDSVQDQVVRSTYLFRDTVVDYDPLSADPDYLVVGQMSRDWSFYNPILATGAFRLVLENSRYEIYERAR